MGSTKDGSRKAKRVELTCEACGIHFSRAAASVRSERVYCSLECFRIHGMHQPRKTRSDTGKRKAEWVRLPCQVCGVQVERLTSATTKNVFCSRKCFQKSGGQGISQRRQGTGREYVETEDGPKSVAIIGGYRSLYWPEHPNSNAAGRVAEHVWLVARLIGRPLISPETVHHKNLVRSHNRLENLELWSGSQPTGARVVDQLAWAREIIALYGPLEDKLMSVITR